MIRLCSAGSSPGPDPCGGPRPRRRRNQRHRSCWTGGTGPCVRGYRPRPAGPGPAGSGPHPRRARRRRRTLPHPTRRSAAGTRPCPACRPLGSAARVRPGPVPAFLEVVDLSRLAPSFPVEGIPGSPRQDGHGIAGLSEYLALTFFLATASEPRGECRFSRLDGPEWSAAEGKGPPVAPRSSRTHRAALGGALTASELSFIEYRSSWGVASGEKEPISSAASTRAFTATSPYATSPSWPKNAVIGPRRNGSGGWSLTPAQTTAEALARGEAAQ